MEPCERKKNFVTVVATDAQTPIQLTFAQISRDREFPFAEHTHLITVVPLDVVTLEHKLTKKDRLRKSQEDLANECATCLLTCNCILKFPERFKQSYVMQKDNEGKSPITFSYRTDSEKNKASFFIVAQNGDKFTIHRQEDTNIVITKKNKSINSIPLDTKEYLEGYKMIDLPKCVKKVQPEEEVARFTLTE